MKDVDVLRATLRRGSRMVCTIFFGLLMVIASQQRVISQSSWTSPINLSQVPELVSDSPVLLCDAGQNVHLIWFERSLDSSYVYYRTDADGAWSISYDIFALPLITYLDAVVSADGILHMVWVTKNNPTLFYSRVPLERAYDPHYWETPRELAATVEAGGNVYGGSGSIAVDAKNHLHVVFAAIAGDDARNHTVKHLESIDSGATWLPPSEIISLDTPLASDVFPTMAIDGSDRLHVGWTLRSYEYGVYSALGYIMSTNAGASWGEAKEIALANAAHGDPSPGVANLGVFSFGTNDVHLTWDAPVRKYQASSDAGKTWDEPNVIMALGNAFGGFNKLAVDSSNRMHVIAAESGGVFHSVRNGSRWDEPDVIDRRGFDPHGQQLLACQGNQLHVVYHDRTAMREIWYSTTTVDSPHIPRTPIPPSLSLIKPSNPELPEAAITTDRSQEFHTITPSLQTAALPPNLGGHIEFSSGMGLLFGIGSSSALLAGWELSQYYGVVGKLLLNTNMVTVIIPCYNHAHYLPDALASVISQPYGNWEAIVVDDGSTDNTRDVAASFDDSRVRYIHQTNQGLSAARNTGIAVATGHYICFLDADDEWEPEFLGRAVSFLDADTRLGGVYVLSRFIDESGKFLPEGGTSPVPDDQFHERLLYGCFLPVHSALLRREAVLGTGEFDTDLTSVEDWDFWIRLSRDWRMKAIAEPLVRYRVVSGSMSMDASRMLKNRLRVFEKHLGDLKGSDATAWDERARRAYARILVSAATDFASQNLVSQSWDFLAQAAQLEPAVLDSVDTLFGMACAKQPRGYRGTAHFLDPKQAETELLSGLEGLFSGAEALPKLFQMSAFGSAHLALWTLNDRIGNWGVARRHLLTALKYRPSLMGDPRHWRTLLRLYIGPRYTMLLRRLWSGLNRAHDTK